MGWTHRKALMVGALTGLVVSGCGGSSSPGDAGSGASSPPLSTVTTVAEVSTTAVENTTVADASTTPTTAATTVADTAPESTAATTTIDPRPINPLDEALALAGELTADAFAAPWTVYAKAGAAPPVSTDSCTYRPDGAVTKLTNGAAQNGPTMQLGDTGAYVYSTSVAFPEETLAMEYVAILNTEVWATCFAAQIQKFQTDNGNDYVVNVATRDSPSLNQGGFESYAEFDITSAKGSIDRVLLVNVFRFGREVIIETQEYAGLSDADKQKVFDDSYTALLAAYNRVIALP
jgi:hypothetical protein